MSEHVPYRPEIESSPELQSTPERTAEHQKAHERVDHQTEEQPSIEAIRDQIEHQAHSKAEISSPTVSNHNEQNYAAHTITKDMAAAARHRLQKHIREDLNAPERTFSKLIHPKAVDAMSELSANTVARPSGFLGGGIFAFLGSIVFLYLAKHYGYSYNFLIFLLLFVVGLVIGLVFEGAFRVLRRSRS